MVLYSQPKNDVSREDAVGTTKLLEMTSNGALIMEVGGLYKLVECL